MIVCSCHGITDTEIRRALGPGGSGRCAAGTCCGGCQPVVDEIAQKAAAAKAPSSVSQERGETAPVNRGN